MTTPKVEAVDFMWWHDMPWSASCKDVKGAVAMRGLPTPDFDALTERLKRVEEALRWILDLGDITQRCEGVEEGGLTLVHDSLLIEVQRGQEKARAALDGKGV